jgi:hypothetical protein
VRESLDALFDCRVLHLRAGGGLGELSTSLRLFSNPAWHQRDWWAQRLTIVPQFD